jgi:hypothetical protein
MFDPLTVVRLPARLDSDHTARLLGFQRHDIPLLIQAKLLKPLGKPIPNSVKYFQATTLEELRSNTAWLDAATRLLTQFWQCKNAAKHPQTVSEPAQL